MQSVLARKQVLLADMHPDVIFKKSNKEETGEIERMEAANSENTVDCQNTVSQRETVMKHDADVNSDSSAMLKRKSLFKPVKRKKKKLGLQSFICKKSATSLDEESIDTSLFYNEPRRCSEPSLFLYNEDVGDPGNFKSYYNKRNQISLNPYYTDVSLPISKVKRGLKSTDEDENDSDFYQSYPFNHDLSVPPDEEVQVPASTWM